MPTPPTQPWRHSTDWSVLRVYGPDAASFLHNMCTNEVHGLGPGEAREALFTDVKAHVLAHGVICRNDVEPADTLLVVVTSPAATSLAEHLEKYHIREDLTIEHQDDAAVVLLSSAGGRPSAGQEFPLASLGEEVRLRIVPRSEFDAGPIAPATALAEEAFHAERIRRKFPLDQVDVDARNLPQELNRDATLISFTKGCYLGQETVARIDALGRVNQLLVQLQLPGDGHSPGDPLQSAGKQVGRITSIARAAGGSGSVALAYVRRAHAEPGGQLELPSGAQATVCPSP